MPKRSPTPKAPKTKSAAPSADVGTPAASPVVAADSVDKQLTELAELVSNAQQVRASPVLADASKRIATLRNTLGL